MANPPQPNYDYSGIGKAEALLIFASLAADPASAWLTTGVVGTISFWFLQLACTKLANLGILILNVAITDIQILVQKGDFNGSFDDAEAKIKAAKDPLTDAEKAAIDLPVETAFRKFAVFGQLRNTNSGNPSGDNPPSFR